MSFKIKILTAALVLTIIGCGKSENINSGSLETIGKPPVLPTLTSPDSPQAPINDTTLLPQPGIDVSGNHKIEINALETEGLESEEVLSPSIINYLVDNNINENTDPTLNVQDSILTAENTVDLFENETDALLMADQNESIESLPSANDESEIFLLNDSLAYAEDAQMEDQKETMDSTLTANKEQERPLVADRAANAVDVKTEAQKETIESTLTTKGEQEKSLASDNVTNTEDAQLESQEDRNSEYEIILAESGILSEENEILKDEVLDIKIVICSDLFTKREQEKFNLVLINLELKNIKAELIELNNSKMRAKLKREKRSYLLKDKKIFVAEKKRILTVLKEIKTSKLQSKCRLNKNKKI